MKKFYFGIIMILLFIPNLVLAKESNISTNNDFIKLSEVTKYYKTIYNSSNVSTSSLSSNILSTTYEITKEEYDEYDDSKVSINGPGSTSTEYKKLTTTIYQNDDLYRYSATLNWKSMPATRSYDVIAIGHLSSVKYAYSPNFSQYYCTSDGTCRTLTTHYRKMSSTGCGAAFKIPTGTLTTLKQTFSFDVEKNTSSTIVYQAAYGDYAHATSTVTTTQAQSYTVGTSGISFTNGVGAYYDNIMPAVADWSGSW